MQEVLPPVRDYKFGQDDSERILKVQFAHRFDIRQQWTCERTIRRLDNNQLSLFLFRHILLQAHPLLMERFDIMRVDCYMNGDDMWRDRTCIGQAL